MRHGIFPRFRLTECPGVRFIFVGRSLQTVDIDSVIPAKAGIQETLDESTLRARGRDAGCCQTCLDSRLRGNDKVTSKAEKHLREKSTYKREPHPPYPVSWKQD